jgi:hypothetical protein
MASKPPEWCFRAPNAAKSPGGFFQQHIAKPQLHRPLTEGSGEPPWFLANSVRYPIIREILPGREVVNREANARSA